MARREQAARAAGSVGGGRGQRRCARSAVLGTGAERYLVPCSMCEYFCSRMTLSTGDGMRSNAGPDITRTIYIGGAFLLCTYYFSIFECRGFEKLVQN